MTLNLMCAVLIFLSGVHQRQVYLFSLVVLNIVIFFFHLISWKLHTAINLAEAMTYSDIHSGLVLLAIPIIFFTFSRWCEFKYSNSLTILLIVIVATLLAVSSFTSYSIRYDESIKLVNYKSIFNDNVALLSGVKSNISMLFYGITFVTWGCLLLFAIKFYKQQQSVVASALVLLLITQGSVSYVGYKIDQLELALFYIGGLPLTVFSVFYTLFIFSSYKQKSASLIYEKQSNLHLQQAITKLAEGLSGIDSRHFYEEIAKILYDFSKANYILISTIKQREQRCIDTLVALKDGQIINNFSYALCGSPCEIVASNEICIYPDNVASLFPEDKMLNDESIVSYIGSPLLDESNNAVGVLALLYNHAYKPNSDVLNAMKVFSSRAGSEIRRSNLQKRLERMAYFDYESKLPNRARLLEVINEKYIECKKNNTNAMFMLIDLDCFGDINRKYGDDVGDQVIRQLGLRLGHYSSKDKFIARNSGDEFAMVLSNVKGETSSVLNVHWQAIKAILSEPCIVGERQIKIKCSMGAVLFPAQIDNRFDVISSAEHAIFRAKESGRNQCALFDPDILAKIDFQKELAADLAQALNSDGQLSIAYQAKVTAQGEVIGSEALIRWQHPQKGNILPSEFIDIAEDCGLIHALGRWVTNEVCKQIRQWINDDKPVYKVSINIAAMQFDNPDFIAFICRTLEQYQLASKYIEIELTESGLLTDITRAVSNLNKLRNIGISIALDDFGTGYSSLSYLQDLPLDVLKIDKSFIDNLSQARSAELVRSIISIGSHMNLVTVAEGTENIEQVNALKAMGCDYFQGFYFCKPLSADEFMNYCINIKKR
ncbi:MAG: putative bifunctional diguanylate cyclase/phosphodiesterase [Pseudoalteromonas sp.]